MKKKAGVWSTLLESCLVNVDGSDWEHPKEFWLEGGELWQLGVSISCGGLPVWQATEPSPQTVLLAWLHQLQFLRLSPFLRSTLITPLHWHILFLVMSSLKSSAWEAGVFLILQFSFCFWIFNQYSDKLLINSDEMTGTVLNEVIQRYIFHWVKLFIKLFIIKFLFSCIWSFDCTLYKDSPFS